MKSYCKCSAFYCTSGGETFLENVILPSVSWNINTCQKIDFFFSRQILNNYVQFEVYSGMTQVASLKMTQSRVSDGEWHHLLIELKSAKDGKDIKYLAVMSLDYGMYQVQQH